MVLENGLKKVSFDNLTIVGDDPGHFDQTVNDITNTYIGNRIGASWPYRSQWSCSDGSLLQYSDSPNHRALRFEFNPNNANHEESSRILRSFKYPWVTRADIAIDMHGLDLADFNVLDSKARKTHEIRSGTGRLQTLYIGGHQSPLRIRIYDKAKERQDTGHKVSEGHWWRIEAQLRGDWLKPANGEIQDPDGNRLLIPNQVADPFEGVRIFKPDYGSIENPNQRVMALGFLCDTSQFDNVSAPTRRKYKKILNSMLATEEVVLSDVFQQAKNALDEELRAWLQHAQIHDVI